MREYLSVNYDEINPYFVYYLSYGYIWHYYNLNIA